MTSIYDGVFAAAAPAKKLETCRGEDYSEIFHGSGSSIPVLDVPELKERKVSVDVRSSMLDYSKIFGGFGNADFGVSVEELFVNNHNIGNGFSKIPAETRSPPQESNLSNLSVENPILSHEASYQSFHGVKQFKMSYHKTNQGSKSGTNGTTHIAQLHAVPGYTCLVDELRATGVKPVSTALNDNLSGGIAEGNRCRKAVSDLPPNGATRQTSKGGAMYQNKINRSRSNSIDMLFDACEIGFRTPPLVMPPPSSQLHNLSKNKGKSERSMASKFGFSKVHSSEGTASPGSPTYFDEEVDADSVAASSAAAVKKAIEEAQARIKIAKEIMERKKEGLQNRVKLNFNNGVKAEERRGDKIEDKANKFRKNEAQEICEEVDTPMQVSGGMGKKNAVEAEQVAPNFRDGEKLLSDEEAPRETHGQKSKSAQADVRLEEAEEWEATKQGENEKEMMHSVTDYESEEKNMAEKSVEKIKEYDNKLKAVEEAHKREEVGRILEAVNGACELNECAKELDSAPEVHDQEEKNMADRPVEKIKEYDNKLKDVEEAHKQEEVGRILEPESGACELNEIAKELESAPEVHDQEEIDQELRVSRRQEETEEAFYELEACETILKELPKPTENERKVETKEPKDDEILKSLKDDQERVENEKQWKEAHTQEENDTRLENVPEKEENETNLEEISGQTENGKRHEEACEGIEFERERKVACRLEENEVEQKDVYSGEDSEKRSEKVQGQDVIEVVLNDFHDGEESEESFEDVIDDDELEGNEEFLEAEENGNILEEVYQMKETEKRQRETCEWIETEIILSEIDQKAEDEKMEVTQEALRYCGNNLEAANDAHGQGEFENQSRTLEACSHEEKNEGEEVTPEVLAHEANGGIMEVVEASFECKENGNESEEVEVANDLEETELFETFGLAQGCLELNEIKKQVKDTIEALAFDKNKVHLGVTDMNLGQKQHNQHAKESKVVCNTGKLVEGLACEVEENNEDVKKAEVAIKQEKEENHFKPSHEERCADDGKNMEAAQLPSMSEGIVEITEIVHEIKTSQRTEIVEENQHKTLTMEEREAEDTSQKEVELEKEHLRKIDEAKEKEREKEMERLAVERAIREARERAFAEARERAERAAAERANAGARRRVMAEGRKPSAEANDKSSAEKSLMEAKLKAERAAVERATAEARERALEKALSEKAAFQARKQAEKLAAEKFHGASRDNGMRKNFSSYDSQNNNSGVSKSPRYHNSSDHGERFDGANGESAQRCKATFERHQRTAERAAKALAEKNMRDLLAQKAQAEKDRLAEALDADIKRWSSGKEGNLRALLSTLQYILGPDSGWQPTPLTDIITTTAVKKAYRKATLFVHPDKLQQRGASIQQKYICEKVFELLKDAWNKFSPEER